MSNGFTTLLFPLLRERYQVHCQLHRREWQETFTDIKVVAGPDVLRKDCFVENSPETRAKSGDTPFRRLFPV